MKKCLCLRTQELMRQYCEKAAYYGHQPIPVNVDPKTITVILNPSANKRKATKDFEKYCAPILYLAGICVDIVQTESEGHARTLMENLGNTDAIVVAGGDGTLSEVVTGLLRRTDIDRNNLVPIGIRKRKYSIRNYYLLQNYYYGLFLYTLHIKYLCLCETVTTLNYDSVIWQDL